MVFLICMDREIIDINESRIKQFIEAIRPVDVEIRKEIDIGYSYYSKAKVVEIFEIRPKWDNPKQVQQFPFARIKYYKNKNYWKIFWLRSDGKWYPYEPNPTASNLEEILVTVKEDKLGCFFG